ncbi:MAG: branched-chain amino acid ABC transporter permease [Rubrivivax sp.]|nr:MAG: branched-chain amino acid ABC transporter permease [Rubrivivax sp.]
MPSTLSRLFQSPKLNRWIIWGGYALVMLVAPLLFHSSLAMTMLCQMGIAIIVCLSYNILLGQGGMLSFGHAVYSGLGSFAAIHTLNKVSEGAWHIPVSLVPLVGGLGGLLVAALLGAVTTKKSGNTFAMITLGVGELVWSMSLMLPEFFGGEGGVSGNRVVGEPVMGITFGPQSQLYYLIAVYCFVCTGLMYAFTHTPLGRMLNAVRDNPERVEFIGYDTQRVRYISFMIAGFFAGIAGGLYTLNFEIVTAEVVSAYRSGAYLLFTFLGGALFFFGPIIGAVLMVIATVLLSEWTKAWLLYLGIVFLIMVMYAPGGVASLVLMNMRVAAHGLWRRLLAGYLALFGTGALTMLGVIAMVEMLYHIKLNEALGPHMSLFGVVLDTRSLNTWAGAVLLVLVGGSLFEMARRGFSRQWEKIQETIEADNLRRAAH